MMMRGDGETVTEKWDEGPGTEKESFSAAPAGAASAEKALAEGEVIEEETLAAAAGAEAVWGTESEAAEAGEEGKAEFSEGEPQLKALQEEVTRLQAELKAARQKAENYYWRLLRMEADFENYRRRVQAEKEELQLYAAQRVVTVLLPVLDNLERGLEAARRSRDFDGLLTGLELVHRGFKDLLQREGLQEIETVGREFDPQYHEAMGRVPAEENQPDNIVAEELQKGYFFKGKVVRPARVIITYRESKENDDYQESSEC